MKLRPITIDFETYWSTHHSLTKMNPMVYAMHPDTEIQSIAIKYGDGETFVLFGEDDIREWADGEDFSDVMLIGHNMSEFDAMLAAWRFDIKPKVWACTLAMARPVYAKDVGGSLAKLADELCDERKLSLEAVNTKGKLLQDFTDEEREAMIVYNKRDTDLCWCLFKKLSAVTSKREMRVIDMTIRMLVELQFELDMPLLERTLAKAVDEKDDMLVRIAGYVVPELREVWDDMQGADDDAKRAAINLAKTREEIVEDARAVLASSAKFIDFLRMKGVPVPMKPSPSSPDKMIPALARSDEEFLALQEHEDDEVAAAASARLKVKSTLLETRLNRFIEVGKHHNARMPVALRYYGADTTGRFSGTMKLNQQNMPRVNPKAYSHTDALRKSLRAPEGYKVVVADLSGIELRINHFLWQVERSMKLFQADPEHADLYKDFAANELYYVLLEEVTKQQRQVGKVAHLGLGFGAGGPTFQQVARLMGGVDLSLEDAHDVVNKWRNAYPEIVNGWRRCHNMLPNILAGREGIPIDPWGLCETHAEGIKTPKGMIRYPGLRMDIDPETGREEWKYGHGRKEARIYAGKIDENIVQHLGREVLVDAALKLDDTKVGKYYKPAHSVHDELIYVVKDKHADTMLKLLNEVMRTPPEWWPELVTWSEGDIAQTYGDAK